jgi:hypothetical protein
MTDSTATGTEAARRPFRRSPGYPAINLETAIRRARELYDRERQHMASVDTIAAHWKYKSLNGPAHLTLAALKKYGLLVDDGKGAARRASLTDLAVDILENPDPSVRDEAVRQAALNPSVHRELWEKYGSGPPSDANLKWILTRERGFTESGAVDFVSVYKDTVSYAKLDSRVAPPSAIAVQEALDHDDVDDPEPDDTGPSPRVPQPRPHVAAPGVTPYAVPIFNGRSVVVEGPFPLSEEDWNQFMTVLSAMKPALVDRPAEDRS